MVDMPQAEETHVPPKAADSGGQEQSDRAVVWGDPASWTWDQPMRVAVDLTKAHPGFWLRVALLGGAMAVIPIFALFFGPLLTVVTLGGGYDQLQGEGDGTVGGTFQRWRSRILPCYGLLSVGMILFLLIGGFAVGAGAGTWFGIRVAAGPQAAEHPLAVVAAILLGGGLFFLGTLLTLRWTAFAIHSIVVEGQPVMTALSRSARVVDSRLLEVIGIGFVMSLLSGIATFFVAIGFLPFHLAWAVGAALTTESEVLRWILGLPMDFVDATLRMGVANVVGVAWMLVFLRQRARLEG